LNFLDKTVLNHASKITTDKRLMTNNPQQNNFYNSDRIAIVILLDKLL